MVFEFTLARFFMQEGIAKQEAACLGSCQNLSSRPGEANTKAVVAAKRRFSPGGLDRFCVVVDFATVTLSRLMRRSQPTDEYLVFYQGVDLCVNRQPLDNPTGPPRCQ